MKTGHDVQAFRESYRETELRPGYNGWLHFSFTSIGALSAISFAITRVDAPTAVEWLTVPATFFLANAVEYFGHRGPMHKPKRLLRILYLRHSLQHHRYFTHDHMGYQNSRDFHMVLFPPSMLLFFLGAIATPIGLLLFVAATHNVAWLFVATAMGYFLTYEWLHFSYHLPSTSRLARLPALRWLQAHHAKHHDLASMHRANFNITFPICDALFGTLASSVEHRRTR